MTTATEFFDLLDAEVDRLLNVSDAENALFDLFSGLTNELKQRSGTSAGISAMSEYIFLQFIKRSLEIKLGITFQQEPKDPRIFKSDKLRLVHDIDNSP